MQEGENLGITTSGSSAAGEAVGQGRSRQGCRRTFLTPATDRSTTTGRLGVSQSSIVADPAAGNPPSRPPLLDATAAAEIAGTVRNALRLPRVTQAKRAADRKVAARVTGALLRSAATGVPAETLSGGSRIAATRYCSHAAGLRPRQRFAPRAPTDVSQRALAIARGESPLLGRWAHVEVIPAPRPVTQEAR